MMKIKSQSNSGQAVLELAFVLPMVLLLLLGLIEFGVLFYNKAMITNASREGARAGMTYTTTYNSSTDSSSYWSVAAMQSAVTTAVNNYLQTRLINFGGVPTWSTNASRSGYSPGDPDYPLYNSIGGTVDVTVTYNHTFLVFPRFIGLGSTISIAGETVMRLE